MKPDQDRPLPKRLYLDQENRELLRQAIHELPVDAEPSSIVRTALRHYLETLRTGTNR